MRSVCLVVALVMAVGAVGRAQEPTAVPNITQRIADLKAQQAAALAKRKEMGAQLDRLTQEVIETSAAIEALTPYAEPTP